jgi:hypothetical protein
MTTPLTRNNMTDSTTAATWPHNEPTDEDLEIIVPSIVQLVHSALDMGATASLEGKGLDAAVWHRARRRILLAVANQLREDAEKPPAPKGGGPTPES